MALRITASNARANAASPWAGGNFTISFWVKRFATTVRNLTGLYQSASGETAGARIYNTTQAFIVHNGTANTSDSTTQPWTQTDWTLFTLVVSNASGGQPTNGEIFINGVGTGSPFSAGSVYDFATLGYPDRLTIGTDNVSFSNGDFAHYAYFADTLSQSQITELLTKQPDAITGISPVLYYPLISDTTNHGTGGATYDLTLLSGAALNSTNDSTLVLSGPSSGASGSISVTTTPATVSITGDTGTVGASGNITVATNPATATITGTAGGATGNIRLSWGVFNEVGNPVKSSTITGRWIVFTADLLDIVATGTTVAFDAAGFAVLDLNSTPYAPGDYVPLFVAEFVSATAPQDRVVKTSFGWLPATAQP